MRADLTGSSDAPPLTGGNFSNAWGSRPVNELFGHIMQTMPPAAPAALGEEVTLNVVAYLLQRMGGAAGSQALTIKTAHDRSMPRVASSRGSGPPSMALGAGTGSGQGRGGATSVRGVTVRGEVKNYVPVTPEMLKNPPAGDWLIFRRNYHGWSYSPLDQITRDNVQDLKLAWVWAMNDSGANQTTPIVHNGVIYPRQPQQHRSGDRRQDRQAHLGNPRWSRSGARVRRYPEHRDRAGQSVFADEQCAHGRAERSQPAKSCGIPRSPMCVTHRRAARSSSATKCCRELRDADAMPPTAATSAPSTSTRESASWRFYTIPREGEPGYDTWGKLPKESRAGVETWIAGSYDPELNLTYWGTAQSKPWSFLNRGTTPFDKTLYANSTLALNADTGKLAWYFQHAPGESFDLDEVFERVLVDIGTQKVSFSAGKAGVLWKLDRRTGQFLGHKEMVKQTIWERIDPKTGAPSYRPDILEMQFDQTLNVCPSTAGGKNWGAMSYNQPTGMLVVPLSQSCMDFTVRKTQEGGNGAVRRFLSMPNTNDHLGKLAAFDVKTMQEVWSHTQRAGYLTGVVSTAGGIAIVGDIDRTVRAHDVRRARCCGKRGWAHPRRAFRSLTASNGKQYIAIAAGLGGGSPRNVPSAVAPEIKIPQSGAGAVRVHAARSEVAQRTICGGGIPCARHPVGSW